MLKSRGLGVGIGRRALMKASLLGGGAAIMHKLFAGSALNAAFAAGASPADSQPVVETITGKIRGATNKGVIVFKGIPYGAGPRAPVPRGDRKHSLPGVASAICDLDLRFGNTGNSVERY